MTSMTNEAFVAALYRALLGRDPDEAGARGWSRLMAETGDPTAVLAGLLGSAEYRARLAPPAGGAELLPGIRDALGGRRLLVVDVGAQILDAQAHVYQPLLDAGLGCDLVGFEPLEHRARARAEAEGGATSTTILPHAIADGGEHVLHVNSDDATSSLFPLNEPLCRHFEHLRTLRTVARRPLRTRRLDDVLAAERVDFLKLDIQGAELMALRGAEQTLARTAVLHCEVEFAPIYRGQPLYPAIQQHLDARGFSLIDLLVEHRYSYDGDGDAETGGAAGGGRSSDRLLWADAVFFRDADDAPTLAAQAAAASLIYRKPSLARHLLRRAARADAHDRHP